MHNKLCSYSRRNYKGVGRGWMINPYQLTKKRRELLEVVPDRFHDRLEAINLLATSANCY